MNSTSMDKYIDDLEEDFLNSQDQIPFVDSIENVYNYKEMEKIDNSLQNDKTLDTDIKGSKDFSKTPYKIICLDQPESDSSETFIPLDFPRRREVLSHFRKFDVIRGSKFMNKINNLKQNYVFKNEDKIEYFLYNNLDLIDLLDDATKLLKNIFEKNSNLILSYITYPEENYNDKLFVQIETHLNSEEALKKLDEFDEKWFLDRVIKCNGRLNFDVKITGSN